MNNNDGDDELERLRNHVQMITNTYNTGINKRNNQMKNQGYIGSKKHVDCIQLLSLNPRGFGPDNVEKVETMLESTKKP